MRFPSGSLAIQSERVKNQLRANLLSGCYFSLLFGMSMNNNPSIIESEKKFFDVSPDITIELFPFNPCKFPLMNLG